MKRYIFADSSYNLDDAFNVDSDVRKAQAMNTNSLELMEIYFYDPSEDVRTWLAANPNLPLEYMQKLSQDPESLVRTGVAVNKSAPEEILSDLAADPDAYVRVGVACNKNSTGSVLEKLYHNSVEDFIFEFIAKNINTPADVFWCLQHNRNRSVVYNLAENPSVPPEILNKIRFNTNDEGIKAAAIKNLTGRGYM